jgi:aminopeptidase N
MKSKTPTPVYLKDYAPPPHGVSHVDLLVVLSPTVTVVTSILTVTPRSGDSVPMHLDGEGLQLLSIAINGVELAPSCFTHGDVHLTLHAPPSGTFTLRIVQSCNPQANTALSGLYLSNAIYCTQMEAEGFRRFAFMLDRPDVMATYRVRIEAPQSLPVLLSNGNLVAQGPNENDWHFAVWEDPHPKPTYLFALVAGDLASVHDAFETSEGRKVSLGIYVEKGKQNRCAWAMESLKASMRWDEERFGRTYDLDKFNIVAVSDFNTGAMENKGLNIFNDKYILARPETATDADYVNIERIIAHEYFHNWSGNRVTCRDWFQLCLKEGLTVFRDQEFTSDLRSRAVKRIEDVKTLRARQFPEDQGPLTHAVRPSSYIEINNFYTPTIYEKGAEICRMLHTLLGALTFRAAMDLYFERHDGEAATVEDFLRCMAEASGRDLSQFAKWYEQAGTPIVDVCTRYDPVAQEFHVELKQHTPATPLQNHKFPLHVPLALALLSPSGETVKLVTRGDEKQNNGIFELTTAEAILVFGNVERRPVLSINRGFSAPIILRNDATDDDLLFQMARDDDSFNRWEAAQTCAKRLLVDCYFGRPVDVIKFAHGLAQTLADAALDNAFKALMLQLPSEAELTAAIGQNVDAELAHTSRKNVLNEIATLLIGDLRKALTQTEDVGEYRADMEGSARRSLQSTVLSMLGYADAAAALKIAQQNFQAATNMTIEAGALGSVLNIADASVDAMLQIFYQRHNDDPLLIDKWFVLKATRASSAADVVALIKHPSFTFKNPNRVYALIGGFTGNNLSGFHAADGSGYGLLADAILTLNTINPQVAARMANGFRSWGRYDIFRRRRAEAEMQRLLRHPQLSNDVFEIISRTLEG